MPEIGSTATHEEVDMKQLLQALPGDVSSERTSRLVPTPAFAGGAARLRACASPAATGTEQTTYGTKGGSASLHGANRLMVIPTNAHLRPPETPT